MRTVQAKNLRKRLVSALEEYAPSKPHIEAVPSDFTASDGQSLPQSSRPLVSPGWTSLALCDDELLISVGQACCGKLPLSRGILRCSFDSLMLMLTLFCWVMQVKKKATEGDKAC